MIQDITSASVGLIGLGRMGGGVARRLASVGSRITVFDVDEHARLAFQDVCPVAQDLTDLCRECEIILLSLPGSPEVEAVVERMLDSGVNGKTVIDLSTSYPKSSVELHSKVSAAGGFYLDASVSGGPVNAAEGTLNIMVGGDNEVFERMQPLLDRLAKNVFHVGGPGSGNVVKLASNFLSISYVALYAEILPLVERLGVDPNEVVKVVSASGANSVMFQLVAPKIIEQDYKKSFSVGLAAKDLSYLDRLCGELAVDTPMLETAISQFQAAVDMGLGDNDISELAKVARVRIERNMDK